jgi:hypothetical protein
MNSTENVKQESTGKAAEPHRGRLVCTLVGAGFYLAGLFGAGLPGAFATLAMSGFRESQYYLRYEGRALSIQALVVGAVVGGWMGWKSYKPAALAASGKQAKPPFFTNAVLHARRGALAVLSHYFRPRWELLTGARLMPWRLLPWTMVGGVIAAPVLLQMFLGQDADFRMSFWVCGALAIVIADCLLVNRIARWRQSGKLRPLNHRG